MQTIYLDISNRGVIPTIYAKQGDVGRKFLAVLTDAGVPYSPPAGSAFSVWYDGDSGDGNYTDIGGASAFSVNANTVSVELITQMLKKDGDGILCLVLSRADGKQISLWNIPYTCEFVPGYESEEANSYFTAFSDAVKNLPYPDTSLSVPGKAADSGAVGTALAGKAPAGFGLGENAPVDIDRLDLANRIGWFRSNEGMESFGLTQGWWFGNYIPYGDNEGVWELNHYLDGLKANIRKVNGVLQPAEWVNPPMDFNVEYRTTKRYNGIPVYTKLIRFGNAPNNATKDVQWAEAVEISLVMNCTCFSGDGVCLCDGELSGVWYTANKTHLYAMTKSDLSAETLFFILEYCKAQ